MTDKLMNFRCPSYLEERIKEYARNNDMNVSQAIRHLLSGELCRQEKVNPQPYRDILSSLGYRSVSDIPADKVDEVTELFIQEGKKQ